MRPKETVLKALELEGTGRVPVALIGGGMWSVNRLGTTFEAIAHDPRAMSDMLVEMSGVIESDIVYPGSGYPNVPAVALGGKIKFRGVGAVDLVGPVVATEEEFEALDPSALWDNEILKTLLEAFGQTTEAIGREYLVSMTAWGPFTLGARIVGEETLIKAVLKRPEFVDRVLGFATDLIMRFFEPLLDSGSIELITIGDPTASGDLISRKQFERFALPPLKRFNDWARQGGAHTMLHICGDTTDRLDLYPQSGASCVSLDHKTDIAKAAEVLQGKMCLAGNVDPVSVLLNGTTEDVRRSCEGIIEAAGGRGGFILMPGCDIPPTVPYENLREFVRVARDWNY